MTRLAALLAGVSCVAALACGGGPRTSPARTLQRDEVALVVGEGVSAALVAAIAGAEHVSPRVARDAAVKDALLAQAARDRGLLTDPHVRWACAAALARRIAERAGEDAKGAGPPADDELAKLSVVHAVVLRSTILSEEGGNAIATDIVGAVRGATDAGDFEKRAKAVAHPEARLVVEPVTGFAADGSLADGSQLDPAFVAAAFALSSSANTSPVVETPFGWHVIRLLEREIPEAASRERVRADLSDAVVQLRARMRLDEVLRSRRRAAPVEVAGAVETLMAGALARIP